MHSPAIGKEKNDVTRSLPEKSGIVQSDFTRAKLISYVNAPLLSELLVGCFICCSRRASDVLASPVGTVYHWLGRQLTYKWRCSYTIGSATVN